MSKNKEKKKNSNALWIVKIILLTFVISLTFSFLSGTILNNVNMIVGIIVLLVFILIGVLFDMIGVAVTSSDSGPFNSMSAKKVKGSDVAVVFVKNADKVSSFCNDVIGDICGIISGSASVIVAKLVSSNFNLNLFLVSLIVAALTASLTIGGKAMGKSIAINNNTKIVSGFARFISIFYKIKK